jgi:hypothetical protein
LAAGKSLLDAVAVMLGDVYHLGLSGGSLDLSKEVFWRHLSSIETSNVKANRYGSLKPWFKEVTRRRDAAIHRWNGGVVRTSRQRPRQPGEECRGVSSKRDAITDPRTLG